MNDTALNPISTDPDIMGGTPVFNGTRIPVDTILAIKRAGTSAGEIQRHYPGISEELIEAAELYRATFPKEEQNEPSWLSSWLREHGVIISRHTIPRKK